MRELIIPVRRVGLGLALGVIAALWISSGYAQTEPAGPALPNIVNAISPMVPYEEGIARIRAQDVTRPKAVRPKLPGEVVAVPDQPASPPIPQTPEGNQPPR
jgi:hypothetical protein